MLSIHSPLSLYAIPAMWVVSYYPVFAQSFIMNKAGVWNNVAPRGNIRLLPEKKMISPELAARLTRMEGAHLNGVENLAFFGLAVLVGNYAGLDDVTLNTACGLYLLTRMIFNYLYINQTTLRTSQLSPDLFPPYLTFNRSVTWFASLGFPFYLFIKSAQQVAAQKSV
ncbi:hypothetical protein B0H34DRAFT_676025 [Crassisporium funariophilum]|nr:hypothetical protein B0H34DRAFT_676025 [Crassisporium funariophilum]